MRKLLNGLGVGCHSTHNTMAAFETANLQKTIDLNHAIGGRYVVLASSIQSKNPADWKKLALETLTPAHEKLRAAGLRGGYHNHQLEFIPMDGGQRPMEVLAANTPKDFMLELDVGTCVEAGADPVAWIDFNPGRIRTLISRTGANSADTRCCSARAPCTGKSSSPRRKEAAARNIPD